MFMRFALALAAAFAPAAAQAEDWFVLGSTDDADLSIDRDRITVVGPVVSFHVREAFLRPRANGAVRTVAGYMLNCGDRRLYVLTGREYDSGGRLVAAFDRQQGQAVSTPIEQGTVGQGFADYVCPMTRPSERSDG